MHKPATGMFSFHDLTAEQKVSVLQAAFGYTRNEAIAFLLDMRSGHGSENPDGPLDPRHGRASASG